MLEDVSDPSLIHWASFPKPWHPELTFEQPRWQGYAASPSKIGNVLFPPYGNAGSENYLLIAPKTGAATAQSGGSSLGLWVAIAVAVVVVVLIVLVLVGRRRPRAVEE